MVLCLLEFFQNLICTVIFRNKQGFAYNGFQRVAVSGRGCIQVFNRDNAFYAVSERSRSAVNERLRQGQPDSNYEPTVSVSTKKIDGHISIHVKDNGNGIPQNVVDKIFQPFFTTKPTGQGTGLGLSLSYDIIKAHGGTLKVESKEGAGTEFVVQLPVAN